MNNVQIVAVASFALRDCPSSLTFSPLLVPAPVRPLATQLDAQCLFEDDASVHQMMKLMDQIHTLKVLYTRLEDGVEREEAWQAAADHGGVSVRTVKKWDSDFRKTGKLKVSFQHDCPGYSKLLL